jgi:hypothetical protein
MPLDSGFRRRNDEKERCLKIVSPAKAGAQSRGFKWPRCQTDDVDVIMDFLVTMQKLFVTPTSHYQESYPRIEDYGLKVRITRR